MATGARGNKLCYHCVTKEDDQCDMDQKNPCTRCKGLKERRSGTKVQCVPSTVTIDQYFSDPTRIRTRPSLKMSQQQRQQQQRQQQQRQQQQHQQMHPTYPQMMHNQMLYNPMMFNPMMYNPMMYNPMMYNPMMYNQPMGYLSMAFGQNRRHDFDFSGQHAMTPLMAQGLHARPHQENLQAPVSAAKPSENTEDEDSDEDDSTTSGENREVVKHSNKRIKKGVEEAEATNRQLHAANQKMKKLQFKLVNEQRRASRANVDLQHTARSPNREDARTNGQSPRPPQSLGPGSGVDSHNQNPRYQQTTQPDTNTSGYGQPSQYPQHFRPGPGVGSYGLPPQQPPPFGPSTNVGIHAQYQQYQQTAQPGPNASGYGHSPQQNHQSSPAISGYGRVPQHLQYSQPVPPPQHPHHFRPVPSVGGYGLPPQQPQPFGQRPSFGGDNQYPPYQQPSQPAQTMVDHNQHPPQQQTSQPAPNVDGYGPTVHVQETRQLGGQIGGRDLPVPDQQQGYASSATGTAIQNPLVSISPGSLAGSSSVDQIKAEPQEEQPAPRTPAARPPSPVFLTEEWWARIREINEAATANQLAGRTQVENYP